MKYNEYSELDLNRINNEILDFWKTEKIFERSITEKEGQPNFAFYEGPPSANGKPGIHHVMARAIKDLFCRYKTMQGYKVDRKSGWDTHGLPIELQVEKKLGLTKDDIGHKISVEAYNKACRNDVMEFTGLWETLTEKMGYWVDMKDPYVTYKNEYIESVWWLLKQLHQKDLLYKGLAIQPYSPAAGTGLSSHELNMPGCYREVKDTSAVAMFKVEKNKQSQHLFDLTSNEIFFIAWTTTPWTLPSNTALAVGSKITYCLVRTFNPYTYLPITVILAKDLLGKYFNTSQETNDFNNYTPGDKNIPFAILTEVSGKKLEGMSYEQLFKYAQPQEGDAFKVLIGDFVSIQEGTGIVHLAPSFGADDFKTAKKYGIGALTLVDRRGRFTPQVTDYANEPVKLDYYTAAELEAERQAQGVADIKQVKSVDVKISIKLKEDNRAFKIEKYEHNYPHCWRTDKPVLYYPLDSWFIKTTAYKERLIALNKTINWKPASTGTGRFGEWLNNLVDWNLSRSRFWGTPLPIWRSLDQTQEKCIGSLSELHLEIENANKVLGLNQVLPPDLHRPFVDQIILVSDNGLEMRREADLIDVWFDSGAMPYAQWHYPFENKENFKSQFPADFIAEGVDQTRGWFFTLHTLAVMLFDSVAFKNVVSNGLVLDKNGQKMSKSLGNTIDPFTTLDKYGADAPRWYMISNANPWDNLKYDPAGVEEVRRKFFGTLYNTYAFFALYANVDGFKYSEASIVPQQRAEIDQWILSMLNSLIATVTNNLNDYEPTSAAREIENFVDEHLSNWYVRLSRRRFWKGEYEQDKIAAYQTLYECLETLSMLIAPIAPFFADRLFNDLNQVSGRSEHPSVHLAPFPVANTYLIDSDLEERMLMAQSASSLVLSLRKKQNIKVRQPLTKMIIPVFSGQMKAQLQQVENLILSEVNVKQMEYITDASGIVKKKVKPNFKTIGQDTLLKTNMKFIQTELALIDQDAINKLEQSGFMEISTNSQTLQLKLEHVEVLYEDIPGWLVTSAGKLTVALDIDLTPELINEGIAREITNKLQRVRKESAFDLTDRIKVSILKNDYINNSVTQFKQYIANEILADNLELVDHLGSKHQIIEVDEENIAVLVEKK